MVVDAGAGPHRRGAGCWAESCNIPDLHDTVDGFDLRLRLACRVHLGRFLNGLVHKKSMSFPGRTEAPDRFVTLAREITKIESGNQVVETLVYVLVQETGH